MTSYLKFQKQIDDISLFINNKWHPFALYTNPETKLKSWNIYDPEPLNTIFTSDQPVSANFPPKVEVPITQQYFHAGMGEVYYSDHPRYSYGTVDTRRKRQVVRGPKVTKTTLTIAGDIAAVEWGAYSTTGNGSWTGLVYTMTDTNSGTKYRQLTWDNKYRGKEMHFEATYAVSGTVSTVSITITDGVSTLTVSGSGVNPSGTLSGSIIIDAAATYLRTTFAATDTGDAVGSSATFTCTATPTSYVCPKTNIGKIVNFAGYPYTYSGKFLLKWDGTDWDDVLAVVANITGITVWGDYIFIAQGTSNQVCYYNGTTLVASTVASFKAEFIGTVAATIWFNSSAYEYRYSASPLNGGSVSAAATLQSTNIDITGIFDDIDHVLIGSTNGIWEISGSDVYNRLPPLNNDVGTYTGSMVHKYDGKYYIASNNNNLYELDPSDWSYQLINPFLDATGLGSYAGRITSITSDSVYLYITIDDPVAISTTCYTYLLSGRWETIDSITKFWWHTLASILLSDSGDNVRSALVTQYPTASAKTNLFLGCSHVTDGVYKVSTPKFHGDVKKDTQYEMQDGSLFTSRYRTSEYIFANKIWYKLTIEAKSCDATNYITVKYRVSDADSFTSLGTVNTSPVTHLWFTTDPPVTSQWLQLEFDFVGQAVTYSPELIMVTIHAVAMPYYLDRSRIALLPSGEFSIYGSKETYWMHDEFADKNKLYNTLTIHSQALTSSSTITVLYRVDNAIEWNTLGIAIESPQQTFTFPEDTIGKVIEFDFNEAGSGKFISYTLQGIVRTDRYEMLEFSVILAGKIVAGQNMIEASYINDFTTLYNAKNDGKKIRMRGYDGLMYLITIIKAARRTPGRSENEIEQIFDIQSQILEVLS